MQYEPCLFVLPSAPCLNSLIPNTRRDKRVLAIMIEHPGWICHNGMRGKSHNGARRGWSVCPSTCWLLEFDKEVERATRVSRDEVRDCNFQSISFLALISWSCRKSKKGLFHFQSACSEILQPRPCIARDYTCNSNHLLTLPEKRWTFDIPSRLKPFVKAS